MNTFSLDEFYDRFYGGRHSIPVPRSEMRKACIGLLVAAKIGTDASVPHENSANDFALTSNGMLKLERYLLIQRRLAAALVIQRWWRPMFSKRTIMKLSEKYRLSVNEKGPHQEEFLEMLQLPSTFASVGRLEPKVVSNHGDSYNDKMYQMYSAILIKWISAVLQEQPASTDFLANLQSGDIFCRLITEMHKNVQCPLLKNGREYAIHKIVFFLEVCISFRIKRVLHFKIENVFGMSNSYSDGIAVMRTLLAVEKHARMTGWQGPPLPLKSVDDMRLGVRQMDSVWSGSASSQASQNNRPSLAPLNIGRVAKPEQTLHVRNHSLPTIIAVKQSESSATHHSRSGSASALPQTDSPVDPSEISLSSPEESYEGSPREIYPIAEHVVAESEKSLSKVVAPIVENSQQVLDFVADEKKHILALECLADVIQQSQANEEFLEENDTERLLTVIEKIVAIHTLLIEGSASPDALFAFSNTVSRLYSAYTVLASTTPGYVKGLARLLEYPAKISQFASFGSDRKLLVASIKLQGIVSVIGPQVQPRIIL